MEPAPSFIVPQRGLGIGREASVLGQVANHKTSFEAFGNPAAGEADRIVGEAHTGRVAK